MLPVLYLYLLLTLSLLHGTISSSVPPPFVITSRPLMFDSGKNAGSFFDSEEDAGFPGVAEPIEPSEEFMTVTVSALKASPPAIIQLSPSRKILSNNSMRVKLMLDRPYLQRVANRRKSAIAAAAATSKQSAYFVKRVTTNRQKFRTTSTTVKPAAAALTATNTLRRPPSIFYPAITAFTLMVLPVAALAVPFIIQAGKKRKRRHANYYNKFDNNEIIDVLKNINSFPSVHK